MTTKTPATSQEPSPQNGGEAGAMTAESQRRQEMIRESMWPRARLVGEILYEKIDRDRTFSQAAAMTYKTLFSLLPIVVLSLLVLSSISTSSGSNALDGYVKTIFEQSGLNKLQLVAEGGSSTTTAAETERLDNAATKPLHQPKMLSDFVAPLVERAKEAVTNKTTGLIAFAVLVYGAVSLMVVMEGTFNQIYRAIRPRSWPRRIMLYWCVLTLGPIGAAASISLGHSAYTEASTMVGVGAVYWLVTPFQVMSGLLISFVLVVLLYRLIPDTQVNWKSAFLGGLVGAVLWELCKWGFGLYVQRVLRTSWYGSLALVPLFMMWIYLTWSAILLGLQVAYVHQYFPLLKRQYFFTRMGASGISDPRWVLSLGVLLYQRFKSGQTLQAHEAAESLLLPNDVAERLLDGLQRAGLVHATRGGTYTLARPAENITAYDLLSAARALCLAPPELSKEKTPTSSDRRSAGLREIEELEATWAKGQTLPALARDS